LKRWILIRQESSLLHGPVLSFIRRNGEIQKRRSGSDGLSHCPSCIVFFLSYSGGFVVYMCPFHHHHAEETFPHWLPYRSTTLNPAAAAHQFPLLHFHSLLRISANEGNNGILCGTFLFFSFIHCDGGCFRLPANDKENFGEHLSYHFFLNESNRFTAYL